MLDAHAYIAIMAGGRGTRFWPKSREHLPKQFLAIGTEKSLLQETVARIGDLVPRERLIVLANAEHRELVFEQIPDLPVENLICEPMVRDTAPCVCLLASYLTEIDNEAKVVILPADHVIQDVKGFRSTITRAFSHLSDYDCAMTIGIVPTHPHTGYGYIRRGEDLGLGAQNICKVEQFTEKPKADIAKEYVNSGRYFWNSGIFAFRAGTLWRAFREFLPDHFAAAQHLTGNWGLDRRSLAIETFYGAITPISLDYGIMEHFSPIHVIPGGFDWNDVGSWTSIPAQSNDDFGNVANAELFCLEASRNIVDIKDSRKAVALIGVEDLVIVDAGDVLLVSRKDKAQDVKVILKQIGERRRDLL